MSRQAYTCAGKFEKEAQNEYTERYTTEPITGRGCREEPFWSPWSRSSEPWICAAEDQILSEDHEDLDGPWSSWQIVMEVVKEFQETSIEELNWEWPSKDYGNPDEPWSLQRFVMEAVQIFPVGSLWRTTLWYHQVKTMEGFTKPWSPRRVVLLTVKSCNNSVLLRVGLFLDRLFELIRFNFSFILSYLERVTTF